MSPHSSPELESLYLYAWIFHPWPNDHTWQLSLAERTFKQGMRISICSSSKWDLYHRQLLIKSQRRVWSPSHTGAQSGRRVCKMDSGKGTQYAVTPEGPPWNHTQRDCSPIKHLFKSAQSLCELGNDIRRRVMHECEKGRSGEYHAQEGTHTCISTLPPSEWGASAILSHRRLFSHMEEWVPKGWD